MKVDPHKQEAKYHALKKRTKLGIPGIPTTDSDTIKRFIRDMELGLNTGRGAKKGPRSHARLNTLQHKLTFLAKKLEQCYGKGSILDATEQDLHELFSAMRSGEISKLNGGQYRSTGDYVKTFKSFWHWHMKVNRKNAITIPDICLDLDTTQDKPPWVYITEEDIEKLRRAATPKYRLLILFLFDSGIRAPTELVNVRVHDLLDDCTRLRIREETSKTFGRTITLLLCTEALRHHIRDEGLQPHDQVFPISPKVANRYLKHLAARVLGTGPTPAGKTYSQLTLYDFRHSSACYWLPRYKSESGLKYRFGWRKSRMIHYYTDLLGMSDTITSEDIHLTPARTGLENRLAKVETERRLTEERLTTLQSQVREILHAVETLASATAQKGPVSTPSG